MSFTVPTVLDEFDARVQVGSAILNCVPHSRLLVVQRDELMAKGVLTAYVREQALNATKYLEACEPIIDTYLDLSKYPDRSAQCISRGVVRHFGDLAYGTGIPVIASKIVAIDAPENMLRSMPMRLRRLIQCCTYQGKLVVILTTRAQEILDLRCEDANSGIELLFFDSNRTPENCFSLAASTINNVAARAIQTWKIVQQIGVRDERL